MNLNIVEVLLYWPLSSLTMSSTTRFQNPQNMEKKRIDATVFLVDTALLNDRNPSALWKFLVFRRISFEGMQDHRYLCLQSAYQTWSNTFWVYFLLQPSLLPISVATNWLDLLRFCKQRTVSNTLVCNPPTWYAASSSQISNTYIPSESIRVCI